VESTIFDFLRLRFRLVVFVVRIWLEKALFLEYLPVPVALNLFAAALLLLILGI